MSPTGWLVLAIVLIAYGAFCVAVGIFKIGVIWKMGKIQGFVKVLGEAGTRIFLAVWGLIALGFGVWFITFWAAKNG